ncbi:MAG: M42 family metallopeptidase [Clostridia bacterium]|nr:M42 family metallopeptidase [Clostridia bacterium]
MSCTQYAIEQITNLLNIPSPTGFTMKAAEYLMNELTALGYQPVLTNKGGVMCHLCDGEHPILLSAHVDTLGAMVRSVKGNGRIRYTHIGGWWDNSVEGENCLVHTRDGRTYSGTVQTTFASQHVHPGSANKDRSEDTMEIVLDELVKSAADVKELGISTGCFISWDPRVQLTESGFFKSRHLDDKASSGVLLAIAKAIRDGAVKPARSVDIMFTVFEEVGHGASPLTHYDFEEILAVDMGCVGADLACDETMVSICCKDSGGPYNYDMTAKLIEVAEKNGLGYAADVYPSYGSDAGAAMRSGLDARHALIGPGVFASHGYERTHVKGIENTLKLACAYISE